MNQDLECMQDLICDVEGTCELTSYAAVAALQTLLANWRDAMHDGAKLESLLNDVPLVVEHLTDFRRRALCYLESEKASSNDRAP